MKVKEQEVMKFRDELEVGMRALSVQKERCRWLEGRMRELERLIYDWENKSIPILPPVLFIIRISF